MNNNQPKIYGEVLAGGTVNLVDYFKKPLVICRIANLFLATVTFSTIISGGWNNGTCLLNDRESNCNFVAFVGITSLLCGIGFLITDFVIPHISSVESRKTIVITDIVLSCLFSLLWFVTICLIIGEWWKTQILILINVQHWQYVCIQVAACFSIFSLAIWVLLVLFSTRRYSLGKSELFSFTDQINRADNRNFESMPNEFVDVVSGSSSEPKFNNAYSNQYATKGYATDGNMSSNISAKNQVVY